MTPSQIFGIVIRVFGLTMSLFAVWYFVYGIATSLGLPEDMPGYGIAYYISGGTFLLLGLYLLRGAPGLLRFSYPASDKEPKTEDA